MSMMGDDAKVNVNSGSLTRNELETTKLQAQFR